jgi:anti-sigma factor RsiW
MLHDVLKDRIPDYALDLLDDAEIPEFVAHLATCAACRADLASFRRVADELGLAAPVTEPPLDLKARLLASLPVEASTRPSARPSPALSLRERISGAFQRSLLAWSAVGLIAILLLGASNIFLWRQIENLRTASIQPATALQIVNLSGTDAAPLATGVLVISEDGRHGALIADLLPPLSEGYQYQVWLIRDGVRTSGGVFSVNPEGYGVVYLKSPEPLISYPAFGVTIEPAGGSPGPTGEKVLGGEL